MLGDEVEFLLSLIKKSYEVLDHHLPELQYHSEVNQLFNLCVAVIKLCINCLIS
jgi:hypothetical protein